MSLGPPRSPGLQALGRVYLAPKLSPVEMDAFTSRDTELVLRTDVTSVEMEAITSRDPSWFFAQKSPLPARSSGLIWDFK